MRMWMIDPEKICSKHLLGEHVEIHMLVGSIIKRKNIEGFLKKALVFPSQIKNRHDKIVIEMKKRGFNHRSKIPQYTLIEEYMRETPVDLEFNIKDLSGRCKACRKLLFKLLT